MSIEFGVLSQPENEETDPIAAKLAGTSPSYQHTVPHPQNESKSEQKRQRALRSGTTQRDSLNPSTSTPKKRKSKNETGIWIIEKSLDKKNWVPDAWVPTRQYAVTTAKNSEERSTREALGIHYRVTRYEPTR